MFYQINLGQWKSVFAVPASVVDHHIKIASEAQLKVLLYLLRHSEEELTDEALSQALRLSAEEIGNAVDFWIERGLFAKIDNGLSPSASAAAKPAATLKTDIPVPEAPKSPHTTISRAHRPDPAHVSKLLKEDTNLAGLLEEAQTVLKKPLSPGDTSTLVMLYDSCGLPCPVIALMMNYLASIGNANMRAIERLGLRWADEGIKEEEDAERAIERLTSSRNAWKSISNLLGIRSVGNPTKSQLENADRWLNSWHFSDEMITEAYERCVNKKNEFSISYINAILKKWSEKGIHSLEQLREEDASRTKSKPKKSSGGKGSVFSVEEASFDVKKYENNTLFND